jgi:alkanesulfonate monooxygenase SsuD/methylene tetrahydromethanopterin reductase-like flavin-dependent oxidoreductase (luciferase family)
MPMSPLCRRVHAGIVTKRGLVSIGVAAAIGAELIGRLAPEIESAGFHSLWVNDNPGADSLAVLEAAADATSSLTLATGVLPVDRRPPAEILGALEARRLPRERLMLGIGSGARSRGALALVSEAAAELRSVAASRILVGALGPRMRRLAVSEADGVLLSWLTPDAAREQSAEARAAASGPHVALYVRTALDPASQRRLHIEKHRYASIPAYAANFTRQRAHVDETVLDAASHDVSDRIGIYREALDDVVLRAITPADTLEDYLRFVNQAKALL